MANAVTFWKGLKSAYDALPAEKILDTRIYFCEDTGEIFKGSVRFSKELLTDYDTTDGVDEKVARTYLPNVQFQGVDVSAEGGMGKTINFIGIGNVTQDAEGNLTIRLGENLNCSLWNGTDGISKATVTGAKSGDVSATVAGAYAADGETAFSSRVFASTDTITAKAGTTASTASGAMSNNGNEVHFEDNSTCYFIVRITEDDVAKEYAIGPITGNGTYIEDGGDSAAAGISCVITNFGEEPKKANGATGYSGNVNFTITPKNLYTASTRFKLTAIDQVKGSGDSTVVVATWPATNVNGEYVYMLETDKPGTPTGASYTFDGVSGNTKVISGVTYILNTSTFKVSATGMTNMGYPANTGVKAKLTAANDSWMSAVNDSDASNFTTWTTVKGDAMAYTSDAIKPLIGKWDNPEVSVKGSNINGDGTAVTTSTDLKLLVCDSNGYITDPHGSFAATTDLASEALMVYDGRLVYPSVDFTGYNSGVTGFTATQPNYTSTTGDRAYTKTFTLTGTKTGGTITLGHADNIKSALTDGTLKVEVKAKGGEWRDASENGIGQATSKYGDASTTLDFVFAFDTDYPNASTGTAVRVTMTSAVAEIKSIALA